MHAVRNIRLCTKDCLCLYVCPTGATDTETGQIDASKCLEGCRVCVDACPSHAISLVPEVYPPQQEKTNAVRKVMLALAESKLKQEQIAEEIKKTSTEPILRQFAEALLKSNRLMAEDLMREDGYMLPQSSNVENLIQSLLELPHPEDFPMDAVRRLHEIMNFSKLSKQEETTMVKYSCSVCGYIHEGEIFQDYHCPVCKQPASVFVKVEAVKKAENKYVGT